MYRQRIKPRRRLHPPNVRGVTAPRPVFGSPHHPRTDRVEVNIAADLQQVSILIDQYALEAPLKKVPYLAMPPIVRLRIDTIDLPHELRKIRAAGVEDKMVVIVHEAISQGHRIKPGKRLADNVQKALPINIIFKNNLSTITTRCHVVDRAGEFDAERSSHVTRLTGIYMGARGKT